MTAPAAAGSGNIRVLPPDVAARIAAGEVIERPASIVRELLDNAIDAGASRISLEIEDGGVSLIRVSDDGCGIVPEQVALAFERHATSKIQSAEDLTHVKTLGFRGEALPSIAAAADVELTSRAVSEPVGVQALLVGAQIVRRSGKPAPVGTTIAVKDLFARLPARRKFLSSPAAETRQIATLVAHYALAYPSIGFSYSSSGRKALTTSGDGDVRHAFAAVYGAATGAEMLDVLHAEGPVAVSGLAAPAALHRANRAGISTFVNGRWVVSRSLVFAIVDAYASQLPSGRSPLAAISIRVPDEEVDVNVHPAKAEVRFRDERAVSRAVRHAVAAALERSQAVAWSSGEPGGAPDESARGERSWSPWVSPLPQRGAAPGRQHPAPVSALFAPRPLQASLVPDPVNAPYDAETESKAGPLPSHREVLPMLRVVGQVANTYIVGEGPDGLYLIDQHAAHERVVFDALVASRAAALHENAATQPLLEPLLVELDALQAATLAEYAPHVRALGLEFEEFGERAFLLRSIRAGLGNGDAVATVRALLDQISSDRRVMDPFMRAAATVACHSSVRAGMPMAMEAMRRLVEDLEKTALPRTCPHGRPTLVHMGSESIERQFGRR